MSISFHFYSRGKTPARVPTWGIRSAKMENPHGGYQLKIKVKNSERRGRIFDLAASGEEEMIGVNFGAYANTRVSHDRLWLQLQYEERVVLVMRAPCLRREKHRVIPSTGISNPRCIGISSERDDEKRFLKDLSREEIQLACNRARKLARRSPYLSCDKLYFPFKNWYGGALIRLLSIPSHWISRSWDFYEPPFEAIYNSRDRRVLRLRYPALRVSKSFYFHDLFSRGFTLSLYINVYGRILCTE